jgi:hypothetical protein
VPSGCLRNKCTVSQLVMTTVIGLIH